MEDRSIGGYFNGIAADSGRAGSHGNLSSNLCHGAVIRLMTITFIYRLRDGRTDGQTDRQTGRSVQLQQSGVLGTLTAQSLH